MDVQTKIAIFPHDYEQCVNIRKTVFIEEQGVPEEIEIEHENECTHFLTYADQEPACTGRFRKEGPFLKFERIATLASMRKKGLASKLMHFMQDVALRDYPEYLPFMYSQLTAMGFYEKLGWVQIGKKFSIADIEHGILVFPPTTNAQREQLLCLTHPQTPFYIIEYLNSLHLEK